MNTRIIIIVLIILAAGLAAIWYVLTNQTIPSGQKGQIMAPTTQPLPNTTNSAAIREFEARTTNTGGGSIDIPPSLIEKSRVIESIQKKLPVETALLKLEYSYAKDMFVLTVKQSSPQTTTSVQQYLQANFPDIPSDMLFIVNE